MTTAIAPNAAAKASVLYRRNEISNASGIGSR